MKGPVFCPLSYDQVIEFHNVKKISILQGGGTG